MYQKNVKDGYIVSIAQGVAEGNISREEYRQLAQLLQQRPQAPEGYEYRLRENLTWEAYVPPTPELSEDITGDELLGMLEEIL